MKKLAVSALDDFVYGRAPHPVTCGHGLVIGAGPVVPELNFTLPAMDINEQTWPAVLNEYRDMIRHTLERAVALHAPDLLVEFETLPPMTIRPEWGLEITRLLAAALKEVSDRTGMRTALRLTPNDTREFKRPPLMRRGEYWESMLALFGQAGAAGADLLSIESTGGKELCDEALMNADLRGVVFALGVLGCRDMDFLWKHIVDCCAGTRALPAGDSACGFANTAMVLAEKQMIPRLFAAVVRVVSVPRALAAFRAGAVGPSKDCAYEGPYMKAMAGVPISMEGKCAACAHLSPVGNISQALCDCWSNESVQNVQLLSGKAPVVSVEQLIYDCRLMNTARAASETDARRLRDWLVASDAALDPQAYVLRPDVVWRISERLLQAPTPYAQTRLAAECAVAELRQGHAQGLVKLPEREVPWLDMLAMALDDIPETEEELIAALRPDINPAVCDLAEYGIDP
jgi:methanol---5-hydroxybenzimidazolylcobamide Co-methyltransferase